MSGIKLNIVESSTPRVFEQMIFPDHHPNTYQYLQNQFNHLSTTIMDSGRQFLEQGRAMVEQFCDGSLQRAARATLRMAKNLLNPNAIHRYDALEDIQSASPLMQRYLMTEPLIRQRYNEQLISGFGGAYFDTDPGFMKFDQYDFRRVHNTMIEMNSEDPNEGWVARTWLEDLREGDRELTFDERIDIMHSQEVARLALENGFDPTCPFGGMAG